MTKIIIAYELLEQGVPKTRIAERLNVSRITVIRWAQAIEQYGSLGDYLEHYQRAKKGPTSQAQTGCYSQTSHLGFARKTLSLLRSEDPVLLAKRVWHASERYNYLQGALREISIALEVAEKQAAWFGSCGPGRPSSAPDGHSSLRAGFCLYRY